MQLQVGMDRPIREPDAIEAAICDIDPPATVAIAPLDGWLLVASWIDASNLLVVLRGSGHAVDPWQVTQLPSVCCGSCSG